MKHNPESSITQIETSSSTAPRTTAQMRNISLFALLILLLSASLIQAQERSPKRGYQSAGSYALSGIENINTTNGNLMLSIPLASLPAGRGGNPGFTLFLHYNSKLWNGKGEQRADGNPDETGNSNYSLELLNPSDEGGWHYGLYYTLQLTSRFNLEPQQPCSTGDEFNKNMYIWKLQMTFPDGSVHSFVPAGYSDHFNDGYYNINPDGWITQVSSGTLGTGSCGSSSSTTPAVTTGMTYYSTDGTYMRLEVQHTGDGYGAYNPWTLYYPDGRKVEEIGTPQIGYIQKQYDRNNNYITVQGNSVTDQMGRSITMLDSANGTIIRTQGVGGENIDTVVKSGERWVNRPYMGSLDFNAPQSQKNQTLFQSLSVVDQIILPVQAGALTYTFGYNGKTTRPIEGDYSDGWGELNSITLPTGAQAIYSYAMDGPQQLVTSFNVLHNSPTQKTLTYNQEYDGVSTPTTETWHYNIGPAGSFITGPDGGVSSEAFYDTWNYLTADSGLVYATTAPDGTRMERIWAHNTVQSAINPYVKTEYKSIKNGAGTAYTQTGITDYTYDKNGNVTQVTEYDWVPYSSIPRDSSGRVTGIPAGATVKRIATNSYYNQAPPAGSTTDSPNLYVYRNNNRRFFDLLKSTEISDGAQTLARTEFTYDNVETIGNLTQQSIWDSTKGAYSSPLTPANSISVSHQYDSYGNPTLTTDARGFQTKLTYGAVGGFTDLYPTEIKSAYGTSIQRMMSQEYDFNRGLVTRATDVDNNVSTATVYDVFGRPTLIKAAEGKPEETHTVMEYSDAQGRQVARQDLNTVGDGKLVSVQHYDQLGRVRLTRQLEDASTQSEIDETAGIKVQTRYLIDSINHLSYQLSSNPYRASTLSAASAETTMGWTRSKADQGGRLIEVGTFTGDSLPAPWGNNVNSTGVVTTVYDANTVTVTDQAGKSRKSVTDALGRLSQVIEDPTGLAYQTSYGYDALGNLTQVNQGVQVRVFSYNSLSRLTSATNPESGTIQYQYDADGNLILKIDPRSGGTPLPSCSIPYSGSNVATCYEYDGLNRVKTRTYNDGTPNVTYIYDTLTNGKGRLASVSSSVSASNYAGYDALGKVTGSSQVTNGQTYSMSYGYNLAGALTTEMYPSGRVVTTSYDNAGRLSSVGGQMTGEVNKTYASQLSYAASGATTDLKLGNNLWEHSNFNSRLQPTEIGLGTTQGGIDRLKLNYDYGTITNNGNVQSQTITVPTISSVTDYAVTQSYTYDSLNRLKSAEEINGSTQSWKQTFIYDRYGNRTFDTNDTSTGMVSSLLAIDQNTNKFSTPQGLILYDNAGNLTRDFNGHTFSYNADNKQTKYDGGAAAGGTDYQYDGDGRRVKKVSGVGQAATTFVYDAIGQMLAEYDTAIPSGNGGTSYLTEDNLGTPRVITDASGNVKARHDYLPFGGELFAGMGGRTTNLGYGGNDSNRFKFAELQHDDETGLDYAQARYYSSVQGRFTSVDPLMRSASVSDPQSFNRYSYVLNDPLNLTDPSGLCPKGKTCTTDENGDEWYDTDDGQAVIIHHRDSPNAGSTVVAPPEVAPPSTPPVGFPWNEKVVFESRIPYFRLLGAAVGKGLGFIGFLKATEYTAGCSGLYERSDGQGGCTHYTPVMSDEPDTDTSANPDPEDNKPDTEDDKYADIRIKGRDKSNEPRRKEGSLGQRKGTDALRRENKIARDAAREAGLNKDERKQLHDRISGQNYDYHRIREIANEIKRSKN